MMYRNDTTSLARAALCALALTGCSGGGGGGGDGGTFNPPDNDLQITNKSDVLREAVNLFGAVELLGETTGLVPASLNGTSQRSAIAKAAQPRAAVTEDCGISGTVTTDDGTRPRTFTFYQSTQTVDFFSLSFNDCRGEGEPGAVDTLNGYLEEGGAFDDAVSTTFSYSQYGLGGAPFSVRSTGPGSDLFATRIRGLTEETANPTEREGRSVLSIEIEEVGGGETYTGAIDFGLSSDPFVYYVDDTQSTLEIEGPYAYVTSVCPGGQAVVETLDPISFGIDGAPSGGSVQVTSGTSSVVIALQQDGGATYQIQGGAGGTITAGEIATEFENGC